MPCSQQNRYSGEGKIRKATLMHACGIALLLQKMILPAIREGEVLLQAEACIVCHRDLHIVDGDLPGFSTGRKLPVIPGHEMVGKIIQKGAAADHASFRFTPTHGRVYTLQALPPQPMAIAP